MLLTSLPAYEKLDDHMMVSHLNELNKKQISGFIVKRKQNTAHLNKLFETLVCFCEDHNIPVLELPQDISYWLVIKYVLSQICSNIVVAKFIYSKLTRDEISQYFATLKSESFCNVYQSEDVFRFYEKYGTMKI